MMLPGLISLAFYKRAPKLGQVLLGLAITVVVSAVLGYPFPGNILSHGGAVVGPVLAAASGAVLYLAVVGFFYYRYRRRLAVPADGAPRAAPP